MFLKYEKMSLKLLNADESNHICKCYWKPKGKERKIAISLSLSLPLLLPASNNFFFFFVKLVNKVNLIQQCSPSSGENRLPLGVFIEDCGTEEGRIILSTDA